jgi:DNA repair exonuclease SbcCD ATPase subunit
MSLRTSVRHGLAVFGLAPASHVTALEAQAHGDRAAAEKLRGDVQTWKARAEDLAARAKQADVLAERLAKAEKQAQRADAYLAELREARERVERAEKAIALSREHLMATETKLDLVQAALTVLDQRTRVSPPEPRA